MKEIACSLALAAVIAAATLVAQTPANTLSIYFIDVEGGQATLVVTPARESLLIDAGYPGDASLIAPAFGEKPSPTGQARDPQRILAAAKDAGITAIDYMLMTHSHADHAGGILEVSQRLPIKNFVNHIPPTDDAETVVSGTKVMHERFMTAAAMARRVDPTLGSTLPMKGVDVTFIAAGGTTLARPLPGAGQTNPACSGTGVAAQEKTENPFSTAIRLQYGAFRFLDVGDLSGAPLFALTCPMNMIGQAEVYLIAHHGGNDGSDPSLFAAVKPLVAIFNNGVRKGAQPDTLSTVKKMAIDGWQLHKTSNPGAENNPDDHIANLDESTGAWIKITARNDGSFIVTNGRTGKSQAYKR